jgi:predicted dehydrogenase
MIEAARAADRHLVVANNHRYRFDFRAIRHAVDLGQLGEVSYVRSTWLNRRQNRPRRGWRRKTGAGGGVLLDLAAQALDLALWASGGRDVTAARARLRRDPDGVETTAILQLGLAGGGTATVEASWELVHDRDLQRLFVLGDAGSADSAPFQIRTRGSTGVREVTPQLRRRAAELYRDSYRQEWATFIRVVRGQAEPEGPEDQLRLLEIVDACRVSAEEGREVRP